MPTYDYICENCGHEFEQFQSITAEPLCKCPNCSKTTLKRLIGAGSGIIFKGSGFYQTDYRSENYKKGKKTEKQTADTATKKETKPADKTKDTKPSEKTKPTTKNKGKST